MNDVVEELTQLEGELTRTVADCTMKIGLLDATLKNARELHAFSEQDIPNGQFLPNMSVRRLFGRREMRGYCLDALKAAGGSLDTRQLASIAMERKGMDPRDLVLRKKIVFTVMSAMKTARGRGLVVDEGKRNGVTLWRFSTRTPRSRRFPPSDRS